MLELHHRHMSVHLLPRNSCVRFFFFKQKTAYEMRISDWSSDVCSSDLGLPTMEDPSRGQGSGILQTLQNYGYDIVLLIALLVVASMFVGVCYHAYTRYSEIHTGRAT